MTTAGPHDDDPPREWWGARPVRVAWSELLCERRELYAAYPRWTGVPCDEDWQRRTATGP